MIRFIVAFPLLLMSFSSPLSAQEYPRWFVFPGEVNCRNAITVITHPPTFYRDSAIAQGFRMGCDLLARYTNMQIIGGQAFWTTEAGVHSMGARYEQLYDSSLADFYEASLSVLDSYIDKQRTLVLVGDSTCGYRPDNSGFVKMERIKQPRWVEQLPDDNKYYFGVGFSQEFFYETSSWQTAEKNAYMALARTVQISVKSMQKKDAFEAQDIRDEEVNVYLQNVRIIARWKDVKKKIYYVLARMER